MQTPTMTEHSKPATELQHKIKTRTAVVAVIGLGYVGLPLLRAFFKAGFPVLGYDIDHKKSSSYGRANRI